MLSSLLAIACCDACLIRPTCLLLASLVFSSHLISSPTSGFLVPYHFLSLAIACHLLSPSRRLASSCYYAVASCARLLVQSSLDPTIGTPVACYQSTDCIRVFSVENWRTGAAAGVPTSYSFLLSRLSSPPNCLFRTIMIHFRRLPTPDAAAVGDFLLVSVS